MAVLSVYPVPDEPRTPEEARQAKEHNRIWCEGKHRMIWQENKRHGFWGFWCPKCQEWRA